MTQIITYKSEHKEKPLVDEKLSLRCIMIWSVYQDSVEQERHETIFCYETPKINLEHILDTMKCHY